MASALGLCSFRVFLDRSCLLWGQRVDRCSFQLAIRRCDVELLVEMGVDLFFVFMVDMIYPEGYESYVVLECLLLMFCGLNRLGHFCWVYTDLIWTWVGY